MVNAVDAIDESVFDAPEEETPETVETPSTDAKPDALSQISEVASTIGWIDKADWKGAEDAWTDAPTYILKAAGEVLPSMRKSLEKAETEIKGLKSAVATSVSHLTKARREGYEQRSRELQSELAKFAEAGDVDSVKAVTADIVSLEKDVIAETVDHTPTPQPDFAAWKGENDWYGTDRALSAAFDAICAEVLEEGYSTPKVGLKEATTRLKAQFPSKFAVAENPNRKLPGSVEAPSGQRKNVGKTFDDMPKEHQTMCLDMMRQSKHITKANYAKEFFSEGNT